MARNSGFASTGRPIAPSQRKGPLSADLGGQAWPLKRWASQQSLNGEAVGETWLVVSTPRAPRLPSPIQLPNPCNQQDIEEARRISDRLVFRPPSLLAVGASQLSLQRVSCRCTDDAGATVSPSSECPADGAWHTESWVEEKDEKSQFAWTWRQFLSGATSGPASIALLRSLLGGKFSSQGMTDFCGRLISCRKLLQMPFSSGSGPMQAEARLSGDAETAAGCQVTKQQNSPQCRPFDRHLPAIQSQARNMGAGGDLGTSCRDGQPAQGWEARIGCLGPAPLTAPCPCDRGTGEHRR
jgi:hypothetical protein